MKRKIIIIIIFWLAIICGISLFLYMSGGDENIKTNNIKEKTTEEIVTSVSKLLDVPSGETPTIAMVRDLSKLKDQPFFAKAKVGDYVLIYSINSKAILYDPIANKVIEVAPLNKK